MWIYIFKALHVLIPSRIVCNAVLNIWKVYYFFKNKSYWMIPVLFELLKLVLGNLILTTQTILDIPTWQMYLSYFWILLHLSLFLCFLGAFPERGKLWEIAETSTDFERGQTHLDWAWKRAQPPPENRGQNRYSYWILLIYC